MYPARSTDLFRSCYDGQLLVAATWIGGRAQHIVRGLTGLFPLAKAFMAIALHPTHLVYCGVERLRDNEHVFAREVYRPFSARLCVFL